MNITYEAVAMGASAGGMNALRTVLSALPETFPAPVLVVQHISPDSDNYLVSYLDDNCAVTVREAEEKEPLQPGTVYVAPPDYHLLVESDRTLSLSLEEKVCYARPAIDVLFETAADVFGPALVGVVLTGANRDGSNGLRAIRERQGLTVVQSPESALAPEMPRAALSATPVDHVVPLNGIGPLLHKLFMGDHV